MSGSFIITDEYLQQLGPCSEGYAFYKQHWPNGGEFQEILDKCCEVGREDWANWLMDEVGVTEIADRGKHKVGQRLGLSNFIRAAILSIWSRINSSSAAKTTVDYEPISSSDHLDKLANSNRNAQIASSGDRVHIVSGGDSSQLASSGDHVRLGNQGDRAKLASSGCLALIINSGDRVKLASSGFRAALASSGDYTKLASSGDYAKLASSGHRTQLVSSGDNARIRVEGEDSVAVAIGVDSRIKGAIGTWITLAEYMPDFKRMACVPVCVRSAQIDGEILKADTWYMLRAGEFVAEGED